MNLEIFNVSKSIKKKQVLDNITYRFESNKIYGVVGRNGAGKTMLFRSIAGLIKVDTGKILVDGKCVGRDISILPRMGIIIENANLYPELSGFENLEYLTSLNYRVGKDCIREHLSLVGLDPNDKRPIRKYSLGMKQRLNIAQALFENPEIILLDEPTNALDEDGIALFRNLIIQRKSEDRIIIIASHNKEDISILCDEVIYMENGRFIE